MQKKLISKTPLLEIGLVLCLFSTQFASISCQFLGIGINITNWFYLIGILFLWNSKVFINRKFPKILIPYLLYQAIVLLYAFFNNKSVSAVQDPIHTIFCLAFLFILVTNNTYDSKKFVKIGWWTTGIFNLLLSIILTKGFSSFTLAAYDSGRLTNSVIAFAFLTFTLAFDDKSCFEKNIGWLFGSLACMNFVLCARKGMLVAFGIVFFVHCYLEGSLRRRTINFIKTAVFLILSIVLYEQLIELIIKIIPAMATLKDSIDRFFKALSDGILGYLGMANDVNNSGAMRFSQVNNLLYDMTHNFTVMQLLFGRGFGYGFVDVPYLEAFSDFGFFIGVFYLYIQLYLPVKYILKKSKNQAQQFFKYYSIITITGNLYMLCPFGYYLFIPIPLLMYSHYAEQ